MKIFIKSFLNYLNWRVRILKSSLKKEANLQKEFSNQNLLLMTFSKEF